MNVCHSLVTTARLLADREAIVFEGQSFTYAQLEAWSRQAAGMLEQCGVRRGDRVGLVIPNVPAFAVWYYGCLRIGAIAVSVNTRLTGDEVAFILDDCDARVVAATEELLAGWSADLPECVQHVLDVSDDGSCCRGRQLDGQTTDDAVLVELEPDEPATILYTSGTTGFPKGATLSHRNVRASVHAFNHLCNMRPGDRLLLAVPLFHCYGQNALLNSGFNVGATIVLQRGFDLNQSKRLIAEQQVTRLFGVPTTFQLLLDSCTPDELSSVDYCFSAAATLPVQISHRWLEKFGLPIYEGYGLTETAPFASYNHRLHYVPGSLGTPVDLVEMKVVDPDSGQGCPPGTPGEIAIRGPNVMLGYWNRPEETAAAIRDGWFYSGDIGQTDENGYFYIVDRLKDMIAVGAQKVFPAEVERVLLDHAAVAEAAVVGFPDQLMGEKVVAFLMMASGSDATADDIRHYCRQHLGSFKVPSVIEFVADLPRNPAGKVLKKELRNFALSEPAGASDTTPSSTAVMDLPPLVQMSAIDFRRQSRGRRGGSSATGSPSAGRAGNSARRGCQSAVAGDGVADDGRAARSTAGSNRRAARTGGHDRLRLPDHRRAGGLSGQPTGARSTAAGVGKSCEQCCHDSQPAEACRGGSKATR